MTNAHTDLQENKDFTISCNTRIPPCIQGAILCTEEKKKAYVQMIYSIAFLLEVLNTAAVLSQNIGQKGNLKNPRPLNAMFSFQCKILPDFAQTHKQSKEILQDTTNYPGTKLRKIYIQ